MQLDPRLIDHDMIYYVSDFRYCHDMLYILICDFRILLIFLTKTGRTVRSGPIIKSLVNRILQNLEFFSKRLIKYEF
jgi:hypothetical protein